MRNPLLPSLARRNPTVVQFVQQPQHSCRRFLFLIGTGNSFEPFRSDVRQACTEIVTYVLLHNPILFCRRDNQDDTNTHEGHLVQVPFQKYLHGCRRIIPGLTVL